MTDTYDVYHEQLSQAKARQQQPAMSRHQVAALSDEDGTSP